MYLHTPYLDTHKYDFMYIYYHYFSLFFSMVVDSVILQKVRPCIRMSGVSVAYNLTCINLHVRTHTTLWLSYILQNDIQIL